MRCGGCKNIQKRVIEIARAQTIDRPRRKPVNAPEHAYHVLEVMVKSLESGRTGQALPIISSFVPPRFDKAGQRHMEYVREHGSFDDMPLQRIVDDFDRHYPGMVAASNPLKSASFEADVGRETG